MKELYLNMPVSEFYGWGVCGKNLLIELTRKVNVKYIENGFTCTVRMPEITEIVNKYKATPQNTDSPFIHTTMPDFLPCTEYRGKPNIGYAFYEEFVMPPEYVENAKKHYDILVGGSTWNKELFESHGLNSVAIPQGVDRNIFYADNGAKANNFIVFSGGKYEDRKAQHLAVKAVVKAQKKYPDIQFLAMWHNLFDPDKAKENIKAIFKGSGVKNVCYLGLYPQNIMAQIMRATTIGIFPNKCEGGTNLVLMEYLACGNPVIANYATGQKDVLSKDYAFLIEGEDDVLVEQMAEAIIYAYNYRDKLKTMGAKADSAMDYFSWRRTADMFLQVAYG